MSGRSFDRPALGDDDPRIQVLEAAQRFLERVERMPLNDQEARRLAWMLDSRMHSPSPNPGRAGFLNEDGTLRFAEWAGAERDAGGELLRPDTRPRPTPMVGTTATGQGLVGNGHLGIDLIRAPAGGGFAPHTHICDHLLIVVAGRGTIAYDGTVYETGPGQVYMIEGAVPHAVGAIDDHVILAVGMPHRAVDSPDRQELVEYETVRTDMGDLTCMICGLTAPRPMHLADLGCPHCPSRFYPVDDRQDRRTG
jgi:quercetin dioxygenase-like cupin family protein